VVRYRDWKGVRGENRRLREENQRLRVDALWVTDAIDENRAARSSPCATGCRDHPRRQVIARDWAAGCDR